MNIALNLFPTLSEQLTLKIGFLAYNYEFKYHVDGIARQLNGRPIEGQEHKNGYLQISDDRCEWTADSYDLSFKRTYTINNPLFLFGENGIACEGAELGLAILWTSKSSNQRGVKVIGGFKRKSAKSIEFNIDSAFPPGQLKGSISFQTILFLKTPGICKINEKHLANNAGMILGYLDEFIIIIDGNGSVFPIFEVSEASQPLWWVKCDWTDAQVDRFEEENVKICLNKANPNYSLLKLEDGIKDSPLLIDIIASALQIIIQKVKDEECWADIRSGKNFEQGSIAQAIHYFITTFNWDVYSPENLARTIRKDLDSRI